MTTDRRWWAVLVALGAIAGCKGGPSPFAEHDAGAPPADGGGAGRDGGGAGLDGSSVFTRSEGTRLKAHWTKGPDGATAFHGWYDSQVKTDCTFMVSAGDELHCLPHALSLPATVTTFAPSQCTKVALVASQGTCLTPSYVWRPDNANQCQTRTRVYRVGAKVPSNSL